MTVTAAKYPTKAAFHSGRDICLALQKVVRVCSQKFRREVFEAAVEEEATLKFNITCNQILLASSSSAFCNEYDLPVFKPTQANKMLADFLFNYAKNNFAVVSVLIRDSFYTSIQRDEEISLVTYLGNIGGLLGLFLGVSLVTLFEIFYLCVNFASAKIHNGFVKSPIANINGWF